MSVFWPSYGFGVFLTCMHHTMSIVGLCMAHLIYVDFSSQDYLKWEYTIMLLYPLLPSSFTLFICESKEE